jgi:hypothetical protein
VWDCITVGTGEEGTTGAAGVAIAGAEIGRGFEEPERRTTKIKKLFRN